MQATPAGVLVGAVVDGHRMQQVTLGALEAAPLLGVELLVDERVVRVVLLDARVIRVTREVLEGRAQVATPDQHLLD